MKDPKIYDLLVMIYQLRAVSYQKGICSSGADG